MSEKKPAITVTDLHKTFRLGLRRKKSEALRGLDLSVAVGDVFGFLGPNGSGKTTTIKILVGLLRADSGRAELFGRPAGHAPTRRRIAYLPELPDFYDYLKPQEFLTHCGRLHGLESRGLSKKVSEMLARVGLDPEEKRPMRKFSKGMLQRCGIAQAMLADPDMYVLDEPMGGLDPVGRRWVKDLILELSQRGKTIFFSSHVLAEAQAACNQVAFIYKGRLVSQGSTEALMAQHAGAFEILVAGQAIRQDQQIQEQVESIEASGPDSLLRLTPEQVPEQILPLLAEKGHVLRSVERRHATLEDIFIQMVADRERSPS